MESVFQECNEVAQLIRSFPVSPLSDQDSVSSREWCDRLTEKCLRLSLLLQSSHCVLESVTSMPTLDGSTSVVSTLMFTWHGLRQYVLPCFLTLFDWLSSHSDHRPHQDSTLDTSALAPAQHSSPNMSTSSVVGRVPSVAHRRARDSALALVVSLLHLGSRLSSEIVGAGGGRTTAAIAHREGASYVVRLLAENEEAYERIVRYFCQELLCYTSRATSSSTFTPLQNHTSTIVQQPTRSSVDFGDYVVGAAVVVVVSILHLLLPVCNPNNSNSASLSSPLLLFLHRRGEKVFSPRSVAMYLRATLAFCKQQPKTIVRNEGDTSRRELRLVDQEKCLIATYFASVSFSGVRLLEALVRHPSLSPAECAQWVDVIQKELLRKKVFSDAQGVFLDGLELLQRSSRGGVTIDGSAHNIGALDTVVTSCESLSHMAAVVIFSDVFVSDEDNERYGALMQCMRRLLQRTKQLINVEEIWAATKLVSVPRACKDVLHWSEALMTRAMYWVCPDLGEARLAIACAAQAWVEDTGKARIDERDSNPRQGTEFIEATYDDDDQGVGAVTQRPSAMVRSSRGVVANQGFIDVDESLRDDVTQSSPRRGEGPLLRTSIESCGTRFQEMCDVATQIRSFADSYQRLADTCDAMERKLQATETKLQSAVEALSIKDQDVTVLERTVADLRRQLLDESTLHAAQVSQLQQELHNKQEAVSAQQQRTQQLERQLRHYIQTNEVIRQMTSVPSAKTGSIDEE